MTLTALSSGDCSTRPWGDRRYATSLKFKKRVRFEKESCDNCSPRCSRAQRLSKHNQRNVRILTIDISGKNAFFAATESSHLCGGPVVRSQGRLVVSIFAGRLRLALWLSPLAETTKKATLSLTLPGSATPVVLRAGDLGGYNVASELHRQALDQPLEVVETHSVAVKVEEDSARMSVAHSQTGHAEALRLDAQKPRSVGSRQLADLRYAGKGEFADVRAALHAL